MLNWIINLFKSEPKEKPKYPREIAKNFTQTSEHGYLVGPYRPLKRKPEGYLGNGVGIIPQSTFDYLNKPEKERVAKASPYFDTEKEMNTEQLQKQLMEAVSHHFDKDAIRPGVLTSTLRNGKVYASVVRYGKQFSGGKKVVCKAQATELKDALKTLSVEFLNTVASVPSPVDALKQLVTPKTDKK